MKRFYYSAFIFTITIIIISISARATVRIDGTGPFYPTIQDAITAAYNGAEILISTGEYGETFDVVGTNLVIRGGYNMDCTQFLTYYNTHIFGGGADVVDISDASVELSGLGILGGGNGIDISDGSLTCRYCEIYYNWASFGGGVFANDSFLVFLDNSLIDANVAYNYGGGIYMSNCGLVMENSRVINNIAENCGGGIAAFDNSSIILTNTLLGYNTATNSGGGLYADGASLFATLQTCTVVSNTAGLNGGGLYASKGFLSCMDTDITHNRADEDGNTNGNGGGLYITGTADMDLNGFSSITELSYNSAANGGGLYVDSGLSVLINAAAGGIYQIRNNHAVGNGGAISVNDGASVLGMGRVWISGNSALNGGGMCALDSSIAGLINVGLFVPVLHGNVAEDNGGGLYAKGTNTALVLDGTRIGMPDSGNSAHHQTGYDGGGGGAAVFNGAILQASDCVFQDNESWNYGGGIYASNAIVTIYSDFPTSSSGFFPSSVFIGNTATGGHDNGGGIYVRDSSLLNVADTMFVSNFAYNGGGAYSHGYSTCEFINTVFVNNEAESLGGALCGWLVSDIVLLECTVANNGTQGIYGANPITLTNCIVWGNVGDQLSGVHPHNVHYSNIQDGHAGTSNINENPLFVNPSAGDYSLSSGSPCIDTGFPLSQITNDCIGAARPYDLAWDMGAYEFVPEPLGIWIIGLLVTRCIMKKRRSV